jgi:hypothetical protein
MNHIDRHCPSFALILCAVYKEHMEMWEIVSYWIPVSHFMAIIVKYTNLKYGR